MTGGCKEIYPPDKTKLEVDCQQLVAYLKQALKNVTMWQVPSVHY